jgi:flagellar protein FlgJ
MLVQQLTRNGAAKAAASHAAPAASGAAPVNSAASTSDRISFVKMLEPYAEKAAGQLGVSSDTLIAQAALETGWGQHVPSASNGSSSLNLYGVKAGGSWNGDAVSALTTEYSGGSASSLSQPFRRYSSVEQGVNDYVTLLQRNSRYQKAMGTGDDVGAFGSALAGGGYATDPVYVQKLQATVSSVKALRGTAAGGALKNSADLPTTVSGEAS